MIQEEYGLVLPNGTVAWGEYRGHPITTPEQRQALLAVLQKTAGEIGFSEDRFLEFYRWSRRNVTITVDDQTWAIDNSDVLSLAGE